MIVGIDEVGRGPWAGPLLVVAVALREEVPGLKDSKTLSAQRRRVLVPLIEDAVAWKGFGWVYPDEIDQRGLAASLRLATQRAVDTMPNTVTSIIIDGTINLLEHTPHAERVTTVIKADGSVPVVSAASILAKEARDAYMAQMDALFPGYGFAHHVGYGTAAHRQAIERDGVTPLHRLSFKPLQHYATHDQKTTPQHLSSGAQAEACVADSLEKSGYRIVERNWRTRWCEIDIIAEKDGVHWCVEVKHRHADTSGSGLDAMTKQKQRQVSWAAVLYAARTGHAVAIAVAETTGTPPRLRQLQLLEECA